MSAVTKPGESLSASWQDRQVSAPFSVNTVPWPGGARGTDAAGVAEAGMDADPEADAVAADAPFCAHAAGRPARMVSANKATTRAALFISSSGLGTGRIAAAGLFIRL